MACGEPELPRGAARPCILGRLMTVYCQQRDTATASKDTGDSSRVTPATLGVATDEAVR